MQTIHIEDIGEIQFKKSSRAKRVNIRVKPNSPVVVSVPQRVSYTNAKRVLDQHIDWIKKQQAKFAKLHPVTKFEIGSEFQTKTKIVRVYATHEAQAYRIATKEELQIYIPKEEEIKAEHIQQLIKTQIVELLRREAKAYIVPRTLTLAKQHRIKIGKITIKKVKTRWGSCSNKNNINLSLFLMLLPNELIDYVICHELAHVKEKNHSPSFWKHLESLLKGSKVLDKQLKNYSFQELL
ncbi:MAG: M48 family metallopeptidase [Aureispira sp.]|nr:M48 family metallopeptidase [Aureispira sp.]